jgi:hypothetical protein
MIIHFETHEAAIAHLRQNGMVQQGQRLWNNHDRTVYARIYPRFNDVVCVAFWGEEDRK